MIDKETRDEWRKAHEERAYDHEIGYVRDDLSYVQRCCYECDEPVPCRTVRLLDALDEAEQDSRHWKQVAKNHSEDAAVLEQQVARVRALAECTSGLGGGECGDCRWLDSGHAVGIKDIRAALDGTA